MSFKLTTVKNTRDNRDKSKVSTVATTVGFLYKNNLSTGAFEATAAATTPDEILYMANETQLASDAHVAVNCTIVAEGDEFFVDTVNNANAAHNGQRMILDSTGSKLNNTGTDSTTGLFAQVAVAGSTTADKKILARKV